MKQQILQTHNPIVIFLTNFTCHTSVVFYCLVFLELSSILQWCFSAVGTPSAFLLLGGTLSLHITLSWAPDTLQKSPLFPSMFCGSAQSQGFSSSSTGTLFHHFLGSDNSHLGTATVWYNFTPSSSQAVEESVIWHTSKFTVLVLCRSLPPSLWCLLWKQNISETTSCFEAKCNKRNLSDLCICFYSSSVLLQQTVQ